MTQLQDLRNDIKAGKKIFEVFEKAETAVNELLAKEGRAAELDTVIADREADLKKVTDKVAAAQGKVDAAETKAEDILAKARADADNLIEAGQKKADKIVDKANKAQDDLSEKLADLAKEIEERQDELDTLDATVKERTAELQDITAKTAAAKEALNKALGTL